MKYTSRADLLIAAGESIKMQEKAGCKPVCKCGKNLRDISSLQFDDAPHEYEFPLAVREGRQVFIGDKMYSPEGKMFTVCEYETCAHLASWTPPKPTTVMVELLREDAELMARCNIHMAKIPIALFDACRKALEK